jgi:hypothetical protein
MSRDAVDAGIGKIQSRFQRRGPTAEEPAKWISDMLSHKDLHKWIANIYLENNFKTSLLQ